MSAWELSIAGVSINLRQKRNQSGWHIDVVLSNFTYIKFLYSQAEYLLVSASTLGRKQIKLIKGKKSIGHWRHFMKASRPKCRLENLVFTRLSINFRKVSTDRSPHPRPDPIIVSNNFLRRQMVKISLMRCFKKFFRVLNFFGCRTGDRSAEISLRQKTNQMRFVQMT